MHDAGVDAEEPPVPNLPLLRKILEKIDLEPDSWVQGCWAVDWNSITGRLLANRHGHARLTYPACGTAYCVAGHAADMTGWTPSGWSIGEASSYWTNGDGRERSIRVIARNALGLTQLEAELLFDGGNTRSRVQYLAEGIAMRAGEKL